MEHPTDLETRIAVLEEHNANTSARKPPRSCVQAIAAAEDSFRIIVKVNQLVSGLIPVLAQAQSPDPAVRATVTDSLNTFTDEVLGYNADIEATAARFNAAKAKCRAGR
jgi:hypothetical protein